MAHTQTETRRTRSRLSKVAVYTAGSALCFTLLPLVLISPTGVVDAAQSMWSAPGVLKASLPHLMMWCLLATLMGSGLALLMERAGRRGEGARKLVRARRGTVLTETLITLPPFFLLVFGLSQQSINTMAQILANVAVHRAAHAVWVWEPERANNTNRAGNLNVGDRACIGVANVMTPVAPGDYGSIPNTPPDAMRAMRAAHAMGQFPINAGAGIANSVINLADTVPSSVLQGHVGLRNNSMGRALDDSSFLVRSIYKFTAAYRACTVTFQNATVQQTNGGAGGGSTTSVPGYNVAMTYHHYQAMPLVGRFFSGWFTANPFGSDIEFIGSNMGDMTQIWQQTGRPMSHFITIRRTLPWPRQAIVPNVRMPNNGGPGGSGGGGVGAGDIRGAL